MSRSLLSDYARSFRDAEFWGYSSWLDIVTRYRRSQLGILWMIVPTAAFILVLGYFYAGLVGISARDYIPYLGIGYVLWRLIIQVINESASVLFHHQSFIMDGRVRLTDYFLRVLAKSLFYFAPAALVVVATLVWSGHLGWSFIDGVALGFALLLLNLGWITVIVSLIGARFPDTHELVTTVLVFGFLLTPILWYANTVPTGSFRGLFMRANPAYHLIEVVRAPVMGMPIEISTYQYLAVMTLLGWLIAYWLYRRYAKYVPLWL